MNAIRITLETLYDILRNEKKREDLQQLNASFFIDVVSYLREKKALLESKEKSEDVFAAGERDKIEYELRSIKRILKEIYEKREKKIIDIALNKSRTGSDIIDTSALLAEEKEFYQKVLKTLDDFRRGVLMNIFQGELPALPDQKKLELKEENQKILNPQSSIKAGENPVHDEKETHVEKDMTKIRFIHPMPSFVWKDMKEYGPYDIGEEIDIYPEVAELIVRKGRAEKV